MKGRLVPRADLSAREIDLMYVLFRTHFEAVSKDQFRRDLDRKNWVVLLDGEEGALDGFSSLLLYRARHEGTVIDVVYSGDTTVDRAAWGRSVLASVWIGAVNHLHRRHGSGPLYWFLIVSGFRTYRFLPVFLRRYYPRHDAPTPPALQGLIDSLAGDLFGADYDREAGVVRLPQPQILRPDLRGIPEGRSRDPHVAFFARRNPGHERGDELVCLAEIAPDNLTAVGRRMWEEGERLFPPGTTAGIGASS